MKIRIYIPEQIGDVITLNAEQTHYVTKVMRQRIGDRVFVFNKEDGEFVVEITKIERSFCKCAVLEKVKIFTASPVEMICIFSVIKPKNIEIIIQKCTELGVNKFIPMQTARAENEHINIERLYKIAIEASEQCGRLDVPTINDIIKLKDIKPLIENYEVFFLHQNGAMQIKPQMQKRCVIIGCEGGFTEEEITFIASFGKKVKISQNILRAETAAIVGCGMLML